VKFILYEDRLGKFRWRLVARNGRTVADSAEGYDALSNVKRAAERVRSQVGNAAIGSE
jgi:uncharacterized protein